jgi:hypothetical protein
MMIPKNMEIVGIDAASFDPVVDSIIQCMNSQDKKEA